MTFQAPEVDHYLTDHAAAQHHDQVLVEMEARADASGFPIVGRAVGRHLELAARSIGAQRVVELGSGFGYSAYWFARAVGTDGEVICTDGDASLAASAEGFLRRAELWEQVRFEVGDALTVLDGLDGQFDVVYSDVDKDGYPDVWAAAAERVRVGGLYVCDNVLWGGRAAGVEVPADPARDAVTERIVAHNRAVATDPRYVSSIVPIRDGVLVALRVE